MEACSTLKVKHKIVIFRPTTKPYFLLTRQRKYDFLSRHDGSHQRLSPASPDTKIMESPVELRLHRIDITESGNPLMELSPIIASDDKSLRRRYLEFNVRKLMLKPIRNRLQFPLIQGGIRYDRQNRFTRKGCRCIPFGRNSAMNGKNSQNQGYKSRKPTGADNDGRRLIKASQGSGYKSRRKSLNKRFGVEGHYRFSLFASYSISASLPIEAP